MSRYSMVDTCATYKRTVPVTALMLTVGAVLQILTGGV